MCVLCWQVFTAEHWAEQQFDHEDNTTGTAGSERERIRRRERHHRTQVLNRILSHYSLRLDDWHNRSYMLSDRKGTTLLVQDVGALWPAAQQLAGRCLDPLDPCLLEALQQHDNSSESAS